MANLPMEEDELSSILSATPANLVWFGFKVNLI